VGEKDDAKGFEEQEVGNSAYLNRHNTEMFESGRSFSGNERHKLWFNNGDATFADVSDLSGVDSPNDGRAVVGADLDDDGDVDLFVHNLQRERHALYRNDLGTAGGFVKVRLEATETQYEAIGATVIARVNGKATAQVLSRGAGFVSCQAPELVFGLGGAKTTQLAVRWPSGALEDFGEVDANGRVRLVEGAGEVRALEAHTTRLPDPLPRGFRVSVGDKLPKLAVLDAKGEEAVLDPSKLGDGDLLYVNFWASYCGSCVKELPDLQELHEDTPRNVVGLSMDAPADLYDAHALFEKRGAKFPAYYLGSVDSGEGDLGLVSSIIDIERLPIPSTVVVDAKGTIVSIVSGPIDSEGKPAR
jgi:thiol-disulfide isomerase/thioredoxin